MPVVRFLQWLFLVLIASLALAAVPAGAQTVGSPIPAGSNPRAIAVDPVLNKVYVLSELTNQVIALDGATNATTAIPTGNRPQYIAVNPTNHRVYVTNANDATMTEIDGTTNTVVNTLGVGGNGPIAIDPITNRIFMVRLSSAATDEVTIVDGNTDTWFTIAIDSFQPDAIALNPVTNQVYVATYATGDVRIVDGNTNVDFPHPPAVGVFSHPVALAVNPVTNRTYVVTEDSRGPFGYIDASNNYTFFTAPGHAASPKAVAVNVVTNKIYAAFDGEVMVMDGATNAFTFIPSGTAGAGPVAIGINPTTNKIYVPNANGTLTVIDGASNATSTLTIPSGATSIGVNPVTNEMYVTAPDSVSIVTGAATDTVQSIPLTTTIAPLSGDQSDPNPTFTLNASSGFSPVAPAVWRVYYQLDGTTGAWTAAAGSGPYTASFNGLSSGSHTLYAFATDTQEGPTVNAGPQSVPLVGSITSYTFTVGTPNAAVALASSANPSIAGQSVTFTAGVTDNGAGSAPTGTVTFRDGASAIAGCGSVAIASGTAQCTTSALTAGAHSIVAAYSGDSAHTAANSSALSQTVNAATATVSLASTPNPSGSGQSVTLTATLSGGAGPVGGSVNFLDGSSSISGCNAAAISSNQATCTTTALASGSHTLSASYSGDSMYAAASSNQVTQTVNAPAKADPSTSLRSSQQPSAPGTPNSVTFTLFVSGNSGTPTGSATFAADGTAISGCSGVALSGGQASCTTSNLATGQHAITATYSGDAAYNAASASSTVFVQEEPTISIASSANPSVVGNSVTFTASVGGSAGPAGGTANFRADGSIISGCDVIINNGTASCSTASLTVGTHAITLRYEGDNNYNVTTSSAFSQTVNDTSGKTNPAVSLTSSPNPSVPGTSVTMTATVSGTAGTPTGNVSFFDGSTQLCIESLASGSAQCSTTFTKGTHNLTASYSGDTNYNPVTSQAVIQTVGALTHVSFTSSVNPSTSGENVTFTLAQTGDFGTPTGVASFTADGAGIGCDNVALVNGNATCNTASLTQGQHNIVADYSGDATYNGFETSPLVQTVNGSSSTATVALVSSANPSNFGDPITLTANVSGSAGAATGTIAFKDGNTPIYGCSSVAVSSGTATCTTSDLAPGSHSITAQYSGNGNYAPATSSALAQTVQGGPPTQPAAWKVRTLDPPTHSLDVSGNIADVGPRTAMDAAGNVYLIFSSFDAGTNTGCLSAVKYASADGHVLWQHDLCDAGSSTFGSALALDSSGDVLIAGSLFQSAYVAKLSGATGDKIWDDVIAPSNTQRTALSIGASSSGDVRVATWQNDTITIFGYSSAGTLQFQRELSNNLGVAKLRSFAVDSSGFSVVSEFDTDGNNQAAGRISRIDNFGSFVWQVQEAGGHLAVDSAGNVIASGTNAVIKHDASSGSTLWTVFVPAIAMAVDGQDNIFATGTWGSEPDDDVVTSKIGSDGTLLWSRAYVDPTIAGDGASIAIDPSGNPVATGFGRGSSTGNNTRQTTLKYSAADGHVLWMATDQDPLGGSFPYAVTAGSGGAATVGSIFNQSTGRLGGIYAIRYGDGVATTKLDAAIALASSLNPSTAGQSVTFTATVTGSSGTPTGAVVFFDGTNVLCNSTTLSSGSATCTTSALTQGTHSITARYGGDNTYNPADSAPVSQVVNGTSGGGASANVAAAAAGATVTASSTLSSRYPTSAINNGDRTGAGFGNGGIWEDANAYTFPDWVQIQFNGTQTIDHVIVFSMQDGYTQPVEPTDTMTFRSYGVTAFDVQVWNGSAWVTVGSVTGNNLVKRTVSFAQVSTDRIRIVIKNALNGYSRVAEIEAWTVGGSSGGGGGGGSTLVDATITLSSSANPSAQGQSVIFTAQLSGSAGTPSGTVSFMDGASAICSSVTLSSGSASCTTSSLSAGSHSISASYSGDGSYNPGSSAPITQTVHSSSGGGTSANVAAASAGATASASTTLSTRYPIAAINNGDRTGAGFGNGGIWEDANAYTFPDWVQIQFNGTQTIDHVIVYSMQDGYTQPVEPTDTMTFRSYGVTAFDVQVWNGSAWVTVGSVTGNNLVKRTVSFAQVATDRIRVVINNALNGYSRLAEVEAWSVGGSGGGTTGAGSASIALSSSANPSTEGQSVTFTATLSGGSGTPTGTVDFLDGGTAISGCASVALSGGVATCASSSLSAGTHSISVSYGGDANYIAGTSSALNQVVQSSGGGGSDTNVAAASAGATATASSTLSSRYPVSAIINGDRTGAGFGSGGVWEDANAYTFPDWVQIDFSGTKTLDHVIVYSMQDSYTRPVEPTDTMTFRSYGVVDFLVQGWDGSQWVTLGAVSGNNLVKRTVSFPAFTTDRIRVVVTNAENGYSRLAEVEAFGH